MADKKKKAPKKDPLRYSDRYGFKRDFEKLNEWARCPKCNEFLVFKDEARQILECPNPKCDFEKPFTKPPTMADIDETHEEWVARMKREEAEPYWAVFRPLSPTGEESVDHPTRAKRAKKRR